MIKKTIRCKYCGQLVEGGIIRTNTQENLRLASRITGTVAHVMCGNLISAWRNMTGASLDSAERLGSRLGGGAYCHFYCSNCNQSFDQFVY